VLLGVHTLEYGAVVQAFHSVLKFEILQVGREKDLLIILNTHWKKTAGKISSTIVLHLFHEQSLASGSYVRGQWVI
jgi:hypothetical protein